MSDETLHYTERADGVRLLRDLKADFEPMIRREAWEAADRAYALAIGTTMTPERAAELQRRYLEEAVKSDPGGVARLLGLRY